MKLWCTAVLAINGCGACVDSHEQFLRKKGMTEESILAAVRLASVIHGLPTVFDTEAVAPSQTSLIWIPASEAGRLRVRR